MPTQKPIFTNLAVGFDTNPREIGNAALQLVIRYSLSNVIINILEIFTYFKLNGIKRTEVR